MTNLKRNKRTRNEVRVKKERVLKRIDQGFPNVETPVLVFGKIMEAVGGAGPDGEYSIFGLASAMVNAHRDDPDRIMGQQVRDGGRYGASMTNAGSGLRHRQWQICADELWRKDPGLSKCEVARCIARGLGGKPNTIRQVIQQRFSEG